MSNSATDHLSDVGDALAGGEQPGKGRSLWYRLYHGLTDYDFVGKRRVGFGISAALLAVTLISLVTQGLNLGLDFRGGVVWEPPVQNELTLNSVKEVVSANGVSEGDSKFQELSGASGKRIRVQTSELPAETQAAIRQAFADKAGVSLEQVPLNSVSSTWGNEITRKAIKALLIFFAVLTVYIWLRFKGWRMAAAALSAVVHDVAISVGVYSVFQLAVTPATVIAFLTILGFSLYDTIVVFDKVNENTRRMAGGLSYTGVVNLSMNQTLMRSINTSLAAVLPVVSLLVVGSGFLGAVALREFALALLVGLLAGSYSSIFIASPILALLERYGKKGKDRKRFLAGGLDARSGNEIGTAAAAAVGTSLGDEKPTSKIGSSAARGAQTITADAVGGLKTKVAAGTAPLTDEAALTHAPRPRKKKRR
jgi:preprotein translocase subunit SecF